MLSDLLEVVNLPNASLLVIRELVEKSGREIYYDGDAKRWRNPSELKGRDNDNGRIKSQFEYNR